MAATKTTCPVTRSEFLQHAQPILVKIGDRQAIALPRQSDNTGSLLWNSNEKITVELNGKLVTCQLGLNLTVVSSKDLPK